MGDKTIIGNTTPRYQYTINGSISWKGVTVSAMFQGVGKRDWDPGTGAYFWGSGPYAQVTVFKEHLDYWSDGQIQGLIIRNLIFIQQEEWFLSE